MKILMLNGGPRPNGNIALGREKYGLPAREDKQATNFIR